MRLRKLAGTTAGALVLGALSVPVTMSAAHAAPSTGTAPVNQDCTSSFGANTLAVPYKTSLVISADGTTVTAPASATDVAYNGASGVKFPDFKIETVTLTVRAKVNNEDVTLTGTTTRALNAGVSLKDPIALPALTGTRVNTAAVTQTEVTSVAINGKLWVPYAPAISTAITFACAEAVDTEVKQALLCTYTPFSIKYPAVFNVRTSPKLARVDPVTGFKPGMPEFVTVTKFADSFPLKVDGADVVVKGSETYPAEVPGNATFELPTAYGLRTGASNVGTNNVKVASADLVMTALGDDNPVPCVTAPWPLVTTLAATSPVGGSVTLAATFDNNAAAGAVEFKEDAKVVGSATVVDGTATTTLTGVSRGTHSYTATFTPTTPQDFAAATSVPATVVVDPTKACVDAEEALTDAKAGVVSATTARDEAVADLATATTADAAATKAVDSAKVTEANAIAAVKAAESKLAAAEVELDAAEAAVDAAPGEIAAATATVTSATAAVNAAQSAANSANATAATATKAATKASKAYTKAKAKAKKAATKAKKAKGKKAKNKANKAKNKANKAKNKANKARNKANKAKNAANAAKAGANQALNVVVAQLSSANAALAAANAKPARVEAAEKAILAAEKALAEAEEKSAQAGSALEEAESASEDAKAELAAAKEKSADAASDLTAAQAVQAAAQAEVDKEC